MTSYKTIQIKTEVKEQLTSIAKQNGWPASYVISRLIQRYVAGHFSGSLTDVIRRDATPERMCQCGGYTNNIEDGT